VKPVIIIIIVVGISVVSVFTISEIIWYFANQEFEKARDELKENLEPTQVNESEYKILFVGDNESEYKILFVGDTSFAESLLEDNTEKGKKNILEEKGYDYPLQNLKSILLESDFVIANLETQISNLTESPLGKQGEGKGFLLWTDIEKTPYYLKKYNINSVSLANNHVMDYGKEGLKQTLQILDQNNIEWFGAGLNKTSAARPYIKQIEFGTQNSTIFVFGAFDYVKKYDEKYSFYAKEGVAGVNVLNSKNIIEQIKLIKDNTGNSDVFVIIFPHFNYKESYEWKRNEQTNLYHELIDGGADLVIGHGSHALQEIERYNDRWIIYGLGNFMFNMLGYYHEIDKEPFSLAAQLVFHENESVEKTLRLYPIFTDNRITNYQPRFLTETEFEKAYQLILETSPNKEILENYISKGKSEIGYFIELPIS